MKIFRNKKINFKKGQVMLLTAVFFMSFGLIISIGLANPIIKQLKVATDLWKMKESYYISESGAEDVVYRVKNNLSVSATEFLLINGYEVITNIINEIGGKVLTTVSDRGGYIKKIETRLKKGAGISFFYGVQVGEGGLILNGNSKIVGNVFSNGEIFGCSGCTISGSAVSAGISGKISGEGSNKNLSIGTDGNGAAYAHTISYVEANGEVKCQVGISNNKNCSIPYADPLPEAMPISNEIIDGWKNTATQGGVINDNYSLEGSDKITLGPKKIIGDLTISGTSILTLTGTIYVTGSIVLNGGGQIQVSSSYGDSGGVIISDGRIVIPGSASATGSGQEGSYLLVVTTSACPNGPDCGGNNAIDVGGSGGAVILNAQNGTINFAGSAEVNESTANKIIMNNNSVLNYKSGIIDSTFVDGPSGGFEIVEWRELEN